jgi:orotate phosphoribosyltransferase
VAGGETAGIPYAAWLADRLMLPMCYVRKQPKGFGRNARIEGDLQPGQRAILVEDLATDGGSKLSFVEGLREAGAECAHTFVVFHYDIFPAGIEQLREAGVALHALATWWDVIALAESEGSLDKGGLKTVRAFLDDPEGWAPAG